MVTLQDIAERVGVWVSTISHVLGGMKSTVSISEVTRQKVWQLAEELGCYPNVAARSLSSQCANAIGLIIPVDETGRSAPLSLGSEELTRFVRAKKQFSLDNIRFQLTKLVFFIYKYPRNFSRLYVDVNGHTFIVVHTISVFQITTFL